MVAIILYTDFVDVHVELLFNVLDLVADIVTLLINLSLLDGCLIEMEGGLGFDDIDRELTRGDKPNPWLSSYSVNSFYVEPSTTGT